MKYISLNTVFASFGKVLKTYDISESEVIEWCADALEAIQSPASYEPATAFITIAEHQCEMPSHLHVILQIARNNDTADTPVTVSEIITDVMSTVLDDVLSEPANIPVALDSNGTPINEYGLAYYRPYFDIVNESNIFGSSATLKAKFTPVRLAESTFFNTIVAQEETGFSDLYQTTEDEYTIVADNILRFSFETGQIAVSYLRQKVDCDTGYPMIVDTYSNRRAVISFIRLRLTEIDFYNNRQGSESRLAKAEQDWQWYCRQAVNENTMPQTIDQWENLMRQRSYILPQTNRYYGFFGKLAHTENRNLIDYGNNIRNYHGRG